MNLVYPINASMLGKIFSKQLFIFFYFPQKIGFDISYKLFSSEHIFWEKKKKKKKNH